MVKGKGTLQGEVETAASSKINRKAWQALGREPSEEIKDVKMPDESNGRESLTQEEDNHCINKFGLSMVDCEEVKASLDRINRRIDAVQFRIVTNRDSEQTKSLEALNVIIR